MFRVIVDNTEFEQWARTNLPQNIMQIMNWLAYQTELKMEAINFTSQWSTGKTKAALATIQQAKQTGYMFESGVGDMNKIGVDSDTSAPPNTIGDFVAWYRGQLGK